jgi:two-component system OmpR family response regulator
VLVVAAQCVADDVCLAGWLKRKGFEVITAIDGQEATQIADSSWQPDVVLVDLTLPNVDGVSVCERIRATNQRVVIFVLSDDSEEDEVLPSR